MADNTRKVSLALVQMAMQEEPSENLSLAVSLIQKAAKQGAQIVCLPELFMSPYFCILEKSPKDFSESVPGNTGKVLSQVAKENKIVLVAGSVYEAAGEKKFNTAMIFERDGSLLGTYRKMHIPHDPGFYEQIYFAPGDLGYKVFSTSLGKIAVLICYDQWFPEAARLVALQGAEIIFYPTAIGTLEGNLQPEGSWQEAWENVQRGHAIANALVVAGVNRVGKEGQTTFWGGSFVSDAFGKTLIRANDKEGVFITSVDLEHGKQIKEGWRFFYNRRPGTYKDLIES